MLCDGPRTGHLKCFLVPFRIYTSVDYFQFQVTSYLSVFFEGALQNRFKRSCSLLLRFPAVWAESKKVLVVDDLHWGGGVGRARRVDRLGIYFRGKNQ